MSIKNILKKTKRTIATGLAALVLAASGCNKDVSCHEFDLAKDNKMKICLVKDYWLDAYTGRSFEHFDPQGRLTSKKVIFDQDGDNRPEKVEEFNSENKLISVSKYGDHRKETETPQEVREFDSNGTVKRVITPKKIEEYCPNKNLKRFTRLGKQGEVKEILELYCGNNVHSFRKWYGRPLKVKFTGWGGNNYNYSEFDKEGGLEREIRQRKCESYLFESDPKGKISTRAWDRNSDGILDKIQIYFIKEDFTITETKALTDGVYRTDITYRYPGGDKLVDKGSDSTLDEITLKQSEEEQFSCVRKGDKWQPTFIQTKIGKWGVQANIDPNSGKYTNFIMDLWEERGKHKEFTYEVRAADDDGDGRIDSYHEQLSDDPETTPNYSLSMDRKKRSIVFNSLTRTESGEGDLLGFEVDEKGKVKWFKQYDEETGDNMHVYTDKKGKKFVSVGWYHCLEGNSTLNHTCELGPEDNPENCHYTLSENFKGNFNYLLRNPKPIQEQGLTLVDYCKFTTAPIKRNSLSWSSSSKLEELGDGFYKLEGPISYCTPRHGCDTRKSFLLFYKK